MKKTLLKTAGALYVIFAIVIAHEALVAPETAAERGVDNQAKVGAPETLLRDNQRLDYTDTKTPQGEKQKYKVVVWTAGWCGPCQSYKALEVPLLEKMGYTVIVKDIEREVRPKDVLMVPTVRLYYKGDFIRQQTYWRAHDLDRYVEGRMSLKKWPLENLWYWLTGR
jgi:thiol-disulfide isomerase/thioredoxin